MRRKKIVRFMAMYLAIALVLTSFGQSAMTAFAENETVEEDTKESISDNSTVETVSTSSEENDTSLEIDQQSNKDDEYNNSEKEDGEYQAETTEITNTESTSYEDISDDELELYDEEKRTDLDEDEIAVAENINVLLDGDYDVKDAKDGISFDENKVYVRYSETKSNFDLSKEGTYDTYYRVEPYSGKKPYLIHRRVRVDAPQYSSGNGSNSNKDSEESSDDEDSDSEDDSIVGKKRSNEELPLSKGEIESIQSNTATFTIRLDENQDIEMIEEGIDPETGRQDSELQDNNEESAGGSDISALQYKDAAQHELSTPTIPILKRAGNKLFSFLSVLFPAITVNAADDKDSMKVSYSGYAGFCGHRTGIKYISEEGDYYKHLVYCLDMNRNTTSGTVKAGDTKVKAQITYCLVNGARTLGGKCHTDKYSAGSATADYFVTSAAIHVINGEVSLAYYNDGSNVYKKISSLVSDAKSCDKTKYNLETGLTKTISYSITPTKSAWKKMSDGLYRSEEKFVRSKSGTITDVKYKITGAPSDLKVGEIGKDASDIVDDDDLKKYDICVAQTDKDKASSNFYVYCNEEAMKKILDGKLTIKVQAKAYSDEKGGRKWVPTVVSQQKITFLEDFNVVTAKATVKLTTDFKLGSISIKKTDKFTKSPVDGATYYLYEDADCDDMLCELSSKGNGLYGSEVETLTQDTYYLKEIINPDGYQLDVNVYPIALEYFTIYDSDGKVTQEGKEYVHDEYPEPVGVVVSKKDSFTQNIITNASFAVFNDQACTVRTVIDAENNNVEVPLFYYDEDLGAAMSDKFIKTQDTYYVKEVVIPDGYKDPGTVWEVSPGFGDVAVLGVENTPVRCSLDAKKKDSETGGEAQGEGTLVGAVYGLYAGEDIKYPDGSGVVTYSDNDPIKSGKGTDFQFFSVPATKDTLLATVRTDGQAEFAFSNLYLGNYYVKEITPSIGYMLDDTVYPFNFRESENQHQDIVIEKDVMETPIKQPFEIIKVSVDSDTDETIPISGAEFTVKLNSDIEKNGWDNAKTMDVLVTDDKGYAKSKELPFGTYLVRETKVPTNLYKTADFTVTIDHDSREPQAWRTLNDSPFKAYIKFIKKDEETGRIVRLPGVTFKIKKADSDEYVEMKVGDKKVSEFITDETGTITTPLKLRYGDYEVTEITAPEGYLLSEDSIAFHVTKEGAIEYEEDEDGDAVITIEMNNKPVKGSVSIKKEGEVLVGAEYDTIVDRILTFLTGDNRSVTFQYENQPLAGAVYHLVADEDIYTADHETDEDGNRIISVYHDIPLKKGTVAAVLTTDEDGEAYVTDLPLGKYHIEEIKAPDGFVLDESKDEFELAYEDDHTEIVYHSAEYNDARVRTELSLIKKNSVNELPVAGATYGVYATVDIVGKNGEVLVEENSLIEAEKTDDEGKAVFEADLPLGRYYVKEIETAPGYVKDGSEYEVDFTYQDARLELLTKEIEVSEIPIIVEVSKSDVTNGKEVIGAVLEILDENGERYAQWTTNGGPYTLNAIPAGRYTLRENAAPYGYMIANEVEFVVEETGEIQKVTMVDERVKGYIEIYKTDSETKKALKGVTFEIRDEKDKVIQELKTDKEGYAKSDLLDICTYKDNGEYDQDIKYYVVETKAAKDYILDDTKHEVIIKYEQAASDNVGYTLELTNKPKEPKLPQTGGDYNFRVVWWIALLLILSGIWIIMASKKKKPVSDDLFDDDTFDSDIDLSDDTADDNKLI